LLGVLVGDGLGELVEVLVGEGELEGELEGDWVGDWVGVLLGDWVGELLGVCEGVPDADGELVGEVEGWGVDDGDSEQATRTTLWCCVFKKERGSSTVSCRASPQYRTRVSLREGTRTTGWPLLRNSKPRALSVRMST
jgi:hypothetical protein